MSLAHSYQFIFVVETNQISQTDRVYISYLLKNLYGKYFSNNDEYAYKYSFVYMNGKRNFNKANTLKEIKKLCRIYKMGYSLNDLYAVTAYVVRKSKYCRQKFFCKAIFYGFLRNCERSE